MNIATKATSTEWHAWDLYAVSSPSVGESKSTFLNRESGFHCWEPTIYIIGKLDSALAPSPIVGVGVFPLAVESSAIGVLRRQCFLLV